jgi:tetraacyldisaccharide 4'-kinase
MTEKDAVKCGSFATANHWYLSVDAHLPAGFLQTLLDLLAAKQQMLPASYSSTSA